MFNLYTILGLVAMSVVNTCIVACENCNDRVIPFFKSVDNVVNTYNKQFDEKVKWKELNAAINVVDDFLLKYEGTARNDMQDLRQTNTDAYNNYVFAVQPLLNWCAIIERPLTFLIRKLKIQNSLSHEMRKIILRKIEIIIETGYDKIYTTVNKMKAVTEDIILLQQIAKKMVDKMENDFKPNGFYGEKKASLSQERANRSGFFVVVSEKILRFVSGTKEYVLNLFPALKDAGIPTQVIKQQKTPTGEEQIQIINKFFETLSRELKKAEEAAKKVKDGLKKEYEEIINLNLIANSIKVEPGAELCSTMESLQSTCVKYVESHGVAVQIDGRNLGVAGNEDTSSHLTIKSTTIPTHI